MAIVKKKAISKPVTFKPKSPALSLSLPVERSVPKRNFLEYSYLIYGRKKIGKTTLASMFPDSFFLMTEPGAENLKVYQRPVNNWKQFTGYLDLLYKEPTKFKTIIVDIGDPLYKWCLRSICEEQGIDHPNEMRDFGATWDRIAQEFHSQCARLLPMNSGRGLVVISHERSVDVDIAGSVTKMERIVPTMEKNTYEFFNGKTDVIAYYTYQGKERKIIIGGDEKLEAGSRLKYNFLTTRGEKVCVIDGGKSEEETFINFKNAFENKQAEKGGIVKEKSAVVSSSVVKKIVKN